MDDENQSGVAMTAVQRDRPSSGPRSTALDAAVWRRAASRSELSREHPHSASLDGLDVVLVETESGIHAFEGRCPHQGALLGEGEIDPATGQLVCRNHRWRFDCESGQRDGGRECLRSCPVREQGDEVLVDIAPLMEDARADGAPALRQPRSLPGPRGLPFFGNVFQLRPKRLHTTLEGWARRYGTPFTFRVGRDRVVAVADHTLNDRVLRARPEGFRRFATIGPIFKELGVDGVFSAEGAAWRQQRRLAMAALSMRHQKDIFSTVQLAGRRLLARWRRAAEQKETEMLSDFMRFTVDVTVRLVFGYEMNTLEQDDDVIQQKLALIFPKLNRRLFAAIPWWRLIKSPSDRRLDRALAELREWVGGLLDAARARLAANPEAKPENFLESMLMARDADGEPYSDDLLYGNAITMLLAGEDTTAHTLVWAAHELCDQPDAVAALRAEADALLGDSGVPASIDVVRQLHYAQAVANETMRLRPIAPGMFFQAIEDTSVGGVAVPKGTSVAVLTRLPALSEDNFSEPERFWPERWLDGQAAAPSAHEVRAHIPFGSGSRICPGRSLALLEMRMLLAMLYQNFDVERVGAREDVREHFSFVMMARGLRVRLKARTRG